MKPTNYFISLILGVACVILSITLLVVGRSTQQSQITLQKRQAEIQGELQRRQAEVDRGVSSDKIGGAILQDMAAASQKNNKIKELLTQNGYSVSLNPSPTPAK